MAKKRRKNKGRPFHQRKPTPKAHEVVDIELGRVDFRLAMLAMEQCLNLMPEDFSLLFEDSIDRDALEESFGRWQEAESVLEEAEAAAGMSLEGAEDDGPYVELSDEEVNEMIAMSGGMREW